MFAFALSTGHREPERVVSLDLKKITIGQLKNTPSNETLIGQIFTDTGYRSNLCRQWGWVLRKCRNGSYFPDYGYWLGLIIVLWGGAAADLSVAWIPTLQELLLMPYCLPLLHHPAHYCILRSHKQGQPHPTGRFLPSCASIRRRPIHRSQTMRFSCP